jgi:hypothetical protein
MANRRRASGYSGADRAPDYVNGSRILPFLLTQMPLCPNIRGRAQAPFLLHLLLQLARLAAAVRADGGSCSKKVP